MVFQPTSPVKSFAVVQRAATVKKRAKAEPSTMLSTAGSSQAEMSDSIPTDLSQENTQRNSQLSTYTADAGGKSRSSWGRMSRLFQRSSEALRTENKLTKPNPNAPAQKDEGDSPTDPMYDPATKTFRAELPAREKKVFEKRMSKETTKSPIDAAMKSFKTSSPKIEMPPIAITGPDEPRSFLDLDSSSDDEAPIVQRASSVKVSKPRIVRYNSGSAARVPKISDNRQQLPAMDKAGQLLGNDLKNLQGLTSHEDAESAGGPADALKMLEGTESVDESTVALPPTPPSRSQAPKDSIKETVVEVPGQALVAVDNTTPTPGTGIKSQEGEIVTSSKASPLQTPIFDGLRSNPISDTERVRLSRTMSAPLPPNRNPNRRVTIRPADLVIHHTDNDHRLFRESIVTTPYPNRLSMVNESNENRISTAFDEKHGDLTALPAFHDLSTVPAIKPHPQPQISTSITPNPVEKTGDRFPSPSQAEHLFLTLSLPSPTPLSNSGFTTSPSTTIEIAISDRATFDDEELFKIICKSYLCNLLGLKRRIFFSRTLSHATPGSADMHLDAAGFIAHLTSPKLGRKKKGWLIWLRNQQPLPKRASSMFSGHSPDGHSSGHGHSHSASGSNMSAYWSPTSHANGVPRMPFSRIQSRDMPPRVILHYRFSVLAIIMSLCLVASMSVLSTILWVLFGVPGQQAMEAPRDTIFGDIGWKREAEFRVLTGLVMGIVVSLLGIGGVGVWCFGGWVLL